MSVTLREKPIAGGKVSLYLDIYHNRTRWTEALNIHVSAKRPTQEDKELRELAKTLRAKFEHDLLVNDNGLINKRAKEGDFIAWYEQTFKDENSRVTSTLGSIKLFMGGKVIKTPVIKNGRKYYEREIKGNRPCPSNALTKNGALPFVILCLSVLAIIQRGTIRLCYSLHWRKQRKRKSFLTIRCAI